MKIDSATGDCMVPQQTDALVVSGQLSGAVLQLAFTNTGAALVSVLDCRAVPLNRLRFTRFMPGNVLPVSIQALDGVTAGITNLGSVGNTISFLAQVTLHAVTGP